MATVKYFSDISSDPSELNYIRPMKNSEFAARFPGVKGMRYDGFCMLIGYAKGAERDGQELPVTRRITYKSQPSKHVCNAKCMGGKVNGACECQCGGKNHGAGMFTQLLAAA